MKIWTCHFVTVCLVIHVIDSCYKYACMRDNKSSMGFDDREQSEKVEGIEAIKQDLSYCTVYFLLSQEYTHTVRYICVSIDHKRLDWV